MAQKGGNVLATAVAGDAMDSITFAASKKGKVDEQGILQLLKDTIEVEDQKEEEEPPTNMFAKKAPEQRLEITQWEIETGQRLDIETRFLHTYLNTPYEKSVIIIEESYFSGTVQCYQLGEKKDVAGKRKALLPRTNIFCMGQQVGAVLTQNFTTDKALNEAILMTKG